MDDKDRVFARFKDDKPEAPDRRELLTIPRRAGASGSRVVEVVHVRSGGALKDRPRAVHANVRAASWDGGFPAKRPVVAPIFVEPAAVESVDPTAHVMPAWEPSAEVASAAAPADEPIAALRRGRGRPRKHPTLEPGAAEVDVAVADERTAASHPGPGSATLPRRVADPFDASDTGANCMRCGYAVEAARERRRLMTCEGCG